MAVLNEKLMEWRMVYFGFRSGFWLRKRPVLQDINFHLSCGEAVGLVGPNGAGKTTTIKLGAGLLKPDRGEVLIEGVPSSSIAARSRLGLLTENQYIYGHLKVREWLEMLAALSRMEPGKRKARVSHVLELFELEAKAGQMMRTLSKGQIQRAGLAQAFLHDSEILLLDEPMSGLDPRWRYLVQKLLLEFKDRGGTILFSSHILSDVEKISDRVILLEGGKIRWQGALEALPRETKGYEVILKKPFPEKLQDLVGPLPVEARVEEYLSLTVSPEHKQRIFELAASGEISLEAVRPIMEEIQELFFGSENTAGEKEEGAHGA